MKALTLSPRSEAVTPTPGTTLVAIRCPQHGATMERHPGYTKEQRWVGAWWHCTEGRCQYTVLFPSPELREQLQQQMFLAAARPEQNKEAGARA